MVVFLKFYIPFFMILFFGTAMIWPSYLLYKRTGMNPMTFGNKAGSAHDYIGGLFKLIFIVITLYGILNSFIGFNKIPYLNTIPFQVIGVVLSLLSLLFIIIAQKTMADSWRIGVDERVRTPLITTGPFAWVRNPIFTGMLLVLVSLFLMIPTTLMAFMTVFSYFIVNIQVRLEEEYLLKVHGQVYSDYRLKVARFVPKFWIKQSQ